MYSFMPLKTTKTKQKTKRRNIQGNLFPLLNYKIIWFSLTLSSLLPYR